MTFFARPNLDNTQFKQLPDSILDLSGQTRILDVTGLTLAGDYSNIPLIVTGGTGHPIGWVMTYDETDIAHPVIKLKESSGGGSGSYSGLSPTTCTVGGLASGSPIAGCSISTILQTILVPTVAPNLTPKSFSFTFSTTPASICEIGSCIPALTACGCYYQGAVSPVYGLGPAVRTGLPTCYNYFDFDITNYCCVTTSLSNTASFPQHVVTAGNQCATLNISYSTGQSPYNSACQPLSGSCCPAGTTSTLQRVVCGIYPWFWGTSLIAPTVGQTLINAYTCKCVANSSSTIVVDNFNVVSSYLWIAIPYASVSKTCWQGGNNPSNNGVIPGGLFPAATCMNIVSPASCWGSTCYKIYVSSYATPINYSMTFCN